jgi:hypothetical protein
VDACDLYTSLNNLLELTAQVIKSDQDINIGDTFTIKFTVRNAPIGRGGRGRLEPVPKVIFKNVHLSVRGTDYATLVGHPENDAISPLKPGQTAVFSIGFRAKATLGGLEGSYILEKVSKASVQADLDLEAFFRFKRSMEVSAQIET